MFTILSWVIYGLIVGSIAKYLHPGEDEPVGTGWTIGIGVAGSFIGGAINWVINFGGPFSPAGVFMGVLGGVIFCWLYRTYRLDLLIKRQDAEIRKMRMQMRK